MLVIGLSGGIGSGKTVASDHFASLGVPIIDTDIIARAIVSAGKPTLNRLVQKFGQKILLASGELDRAILRNIAFSSRKNKQALDNITHPAIRMETLKNIQECKGNYCIVVIPLLTIDSPFLKVMQRILIVTAEDEIKIKRVQERSQLSREQTLKIMAAQPQDFERLKFADDVIENNSNIKHVHVEVERLHIIYSTLARDFL